MLLTTIGKIQVSRSFQIGWIGNPETLNNYKTLFRQPLTTIQVNRSSHRFQISSAIGIRTKIVRIGHRISKEVKVLTPAIEVLNIKVQWIKALVMQSLSNGRLTVATTQTEAPFSGSMQPLRNTTANRSGTKWPLDQHKHYFGNCPQFLSRDVSRRNSEAAKKSPCFDCLSSREPMYANVWTTGSTRQKQWHSNSGLQSWFPV